MEKDVVSISSFAKGVDNNKISFVQFSVKNSSIKNTWLVQSCQVHLIHTSKPVHDQSDTEKRAMVNNVSSNFMVREFEKNPKFPIELKPMSNVSLIYQIIDLNKREDGKDENDNNTKGKIENLLLKTLKDEKIQKTEQLSGSDNERSLVSYSFQTLCGFFYKPKKTTEERKNILYSKYEVIHWEGMVKKELYFSMEILNRKVKIVKGKSFKVSCFLMNYSEKKYDFSVGHRTTKSFVCEDSSLKISVSSGECKRFVLNFVALEQGITDISNLYLKDLKSKQKYMFPYQLKVLVH